jgi:hypothetical protein
VPLNLVRHIALLNLLLESKGLFLERFSLGSAALRLIDVCEIAERSGNLRQVTGIVIKLLFLNGKRPFIEGFRFGELAFGNVDPGEVVECGNDVWVVHT